MKSYALIRILNVECCEFQHGSVSSFTTKLKSNCNLSLMNDQEVDEKKGKFNCGNRQLQYREYAQYEKFREYQRGWGLRAVQDIYEGLCLSGLSFSFSLTS